MKIKIEYNGAYPNLCRGHLKVFIDDKLYDFGEYCLISGGTTWIDENFDDHTTHGKWDVEFPKDFPENLKKPVLKKINEEIPHGCCGGCI